MEKRHYLIEVEVRDKNGKLFPYPEHGNCTGMKFEWYSWSENHMEHLMRSLHRDLKVWMPENQFNIEAGVIHGIDSNPRMHTLMILYSFYGNEGRFVVHN